MQKMILIGFIIPNVAIERERVEAANSIREIDL